MTEDICRVFCDNFENVSIHRFLDGEFKKFKQVAVMGLRRCRTDGSIEAEKLCEAASHPERLPTLDMLETGRYTLPTSPLKVENFRGAEFNEFELFEQYDPPELVGYMEECGRRKYELSGVTHSLCELSPSCVKTRAFL